jgi:phage-related protein
VREQRARQIVFVGTALEDLCAFPAEVRRAVGFALYQAQCGGKHPGVKPLKGFKGAGVLECVEDFGGGTFRVVYTVRYAATLYVLHAFEKKSKRGAKTPKGHVDLVRARLRAVAEAESRRDRDK